MRHAVILAGGTGTRLWPASRRNRPKQFLPLGALPGESLLAATARRVNEVARVAAQAPLVVTAADQAGMVRMSLPGLPPDAVLREPVARNTAAALGLAAVHLLHRDPRAVMAALPADHHIADEAGFVALAGRAFALAEDKDVIVTLGIVPDRPETGYGWLEPGQPAGGGAVTVSRFIEKPELVDAERYQAVGYLWNAGIFFLRAQRMLDELARHLPETHAGLQQIAAALAAGGDAAAVTAQVYPTFASISIDHAIMEKTDRIVMLPADIGWSDVGSFAALTGYRQADDDGNVTEGTVVLHEAQGNVVLADPEFAIAVIGVDDLVIVQSGNGILVVPRARAQDVRHAVAELDRRGLRRFL